jgi:hypothetical protein
MCSKKWYLKSNISCDADLLNELLETDVSWDDAIVVSTGKLRKLWDSLRTAQFSVRERQLERTVPRPALLPVKTAHFTQFFPQVCWMNCYKAMCFQMLPSWCQEVNWGNCGNPWENCAVLCAWKTTGKDISEACAIVCQNCAVYSVFSSSMTSRSKIVQFNLEGVGRLTVTKDPSLRHE